MFWKKDPVVGERWVHRYSKEEIVVIITNIVRYSPSYLDVIYERVDGSGGKRSTSLKGFKDFYKREVRK